MALLLTLSAGLGYAFAPGVIPSTSRVAQMSSVAPLMNSKWIPKVPYKFPDVDDPQWISIYSRMYRNRIIFLSNYLDDNIANQMIATLFYMNKESSTKEVCLYLNVRGGDMKAGLALYDTMKMMSYDFQTVNMGLCADVGSFLVAAGTKGKRLALPNSRFRMENPRVDPIYDNEGNPTVRVMQATEMRLEINEILRDKQRMLDCLVQFTGRSKEQLNRDFQRDFYLDANQAMDYGIVDGLLLPNEIDEQAYKETLKI